MAFSDFDLRTARERFDLTPAPRSSSTSATPSSRSSRPRRKTFPPEYYLHQVGQVLAILVRLAAGEGMAPQALQPTGPA
jgi:hypothetical protein